jgi:molybdopterin synthase catalytic subunit
MSAERIEIRVLYFAAARELAGAREETMTVEAPATVGTVLDAIVQAHPALDAHRARLRVAVNEAFAAPSEPVAHGDEIALIPPVAGG